MGPPDALKDLLVNRDIMGTLGCLPFSPSTHVMMVPTGTTTMGTSSAFLCDQIAPEGWGYDEFFRQGLDIPEDQILHRNQIVICEVPGVQLPLGQPIWLLNVQDCDFINNEGQLQFGYTYQASSTWSHVGKPDTTKLRICELCAGGFAGWKFATNCISQFLPTTPQTVAIEIDPTKAYAYAITHHAMLIPDAAQLSRDTFSEISRDFIAVADARDNKIKESLSQWSPNLVTISAPCPAWSTATNEPGLDRGDGSLLAELLLDCRLTRPTLICLEQVQGFHYHDHKAWILRLLHYMGYQIVFQKLLNMNQQSKTTRIRWIAIAARIHEQVPIIAFEHWRIIPSTEHPNCIMPLTREQKAHLQITEDIYRIATDPTFAQGRFKADTPEGIMKKITHDGGSDIPTFMAQYGNQHNLSPHLLQSRGFLGHYVADDACDHGVRHWHPIEVACCHGFHSQTLS